MTPKNGGGNPSIIFIGGFIMTIKVWLRDEKTGIECGINKDGELFIGDNKSGYNLRDTKENREYIINDFCRYTGRQKPVIMANGEPYQGNESMIEFSR